MTEENEYGLTEKGFKRKKYRDVLDSLKIRGRGYYGENVNFSDTSPMGYMLRIAAWYIARVWEQLEKVYYSAFIHTANGVQLDRLVKYLGLSRFDKRRSRGEIKIEGEPETFIPEGTLFSTIDNIQFESSESLTLDETGEGIVEIISLEDGTESNVEANAINILVDTIPDVSEVYNEEPTLGGRNVETDDELRARYERSLASAGASTLSSIKSAILGVEGVIDVIMRENTSMEIENDIPPKSIAPVIYGGTDEDVALAILDTKAAGIQSWGITDVTVEDNFEYEHVIGITRPDVINIYADITISIDSEEFPASGEDDIKDNIISYIGGTEETGGLGLGEDVIITKLISKVHKTDGILDVDLKIGTSENPTGTENISIDTLEVAATSEGFIEVNING